MVPPCYRPTAEARAILERVRDGYSVSHEEALPYVKAGLIDVYSLPTSRSGYELTEAGTEALVRRCDCCNLPISDQQFAIARRHSFEKDSFIAILNGHERHWYTP